MPRQHAAKVISISWPDCNAVLANLGMVSSPCFRVLQISRMMPHSFRATLKSPTFSRRPFATLYKYMHGSLADYAVGMLCSNGCTAFGQAAHLRPADLRVLPVAPVAPWKSRGELW